ncbi:MAG TPA: hypothetical protein VK459_23435 [Polyangiaceae bacterium]|nr:hypothetical protein [Polyangiaceae bacterium]
MRELAAALCVLLATLVFLSLSPGCGEEPPEPRDESPKVCSSPSGCAPDEVCDFPDDQCGSGSAGACLKRPALCSDGIPACGCDGETYDSAVCAALAGSDIAAGGGCAAPQGAFACGPLFCFLPAAYCERTAFAGEGCEGAEAFQCAFFDPNCAPQDCSCLPGLECQMAPSGGSIATKTSPGCPP